MMNSLYSEPANDSQDVPATSFFYRDMATSAPTAGKEKRQPESKAPGESEKQLPPGPTAQEIGDMVARARGEGAAETERRLSGEHLARLEAEAARIRQALKHFEVERKDYFSRIESEVVQLALSIAAKILHREAQVDPLLVAALVRVAIDKLHDCSSVSVRIHPAKAAQWRERLANPANGSTITIVEDNHLGLDDCFLETDLGSANFSIDAQLKEVEQGFFDLLAQRPECK